MAATGLEPPTQTDELLRVNRALDDQVKTLVKTEQRFFQSQRALARRQARLDALNRFAVDAAELSDPREVLTRASNVLFSVFALDQAVGFLANPSGSFFPVVARGGQGDAPDLDRAIEAMAQTSVVASLPAEPVIGRLDALRARPDLSQLFDRFDRLFQAAGPDRVGDASAPGIVMPLSREGGKVVGVMIFVRLTAPAGYHEELPTLADLGFISVVARLVASSVNNMRLVRDLQVSVDQLEQAQRDRVDRERLAALGEFAAMVAHEVRNPLGAIFNAVSMLRRSVEGEGARLIEVVDEESHRLDRIVADLIDFARPNPPHLRPERPLRIVESLLEGVRASMPQANISVVAEAELPEVMADARMLRQAIFNLLLNAVQASGPGQPVVVRLGSDSNGGTRIAVEDRGAGVAADVAPRIFEPFFTTKAAGTGLGLSVVKRVADAHLGSIVMAPRPGGGTVFTLTIPAAVA